MTDPAGGFYSAEDADSEGVEGKFYVWTEEEIRQVLPAEQADLVIEAFNVRKDGNYHDEASGEPAGRNILHLSDPMMPQDEIIVTIQDERPTRSLLERARQTLFEVREKRVHPGKDDKVLTDWNGLMIAALAKAAAAAWMSRTMPARPARRPTSCWSTAARPRGRLLHRWREGEAVDHWQPGRLRLPHLGPDRVCTRRRSRRDTCRRPWT